MGNLKKKALLRTARIPGYKIARGRGVGVVGLADLRDCLFPLFVSRHRPSSSSSKRATKRAAAATRRKTWKLWARVEIWWRKEKDDARQVVGKEAMGQRTMRVCECSQREVVLALRCFQRSGASCVVLDVVGEEAAENLLLTFSGAFFQCASCQWVLFGDFTVDDFPGRPEPTESPGVSSGY